MEDLGEGRIYLWLMSRGDGRLKDSMGGLSGDWIRERLSLLGVSNDLKYGKHKKLTVS